MMRSSLVIAAFIALLSSCAAKDFESERSRASESAPSAAAAEPMQEEEEDMDDAEGGTGTKMALDEGKMGRGSGRATGQYAMKNNNADPQLAKKEAIDAARKAGVLGVLESKKRDRRPRPKTVSRDGAPGASEVQTRSWFPETFLFEPIVVTDKSGKAQVTARVPDRLTSWRVLALAHSRSGKQAGAVASFLGTLETYVEIIAPPTLKVGDVVEMPIQVVNTTAKKIDRALEVSATNAAVTAGGPVSVAAKGSSVRYATLTAAAPGSVELLAKLSGADAVTRKIAVEPTGRPESKTKSGTLAEPRKFKLNFGGERRGTFARLQVYSGARALLGQELASASARSGLANDAFGLLITGQAPKLLADFGAERDDEMLRKQRIILTQRVVRHARVMDLSSATLIALATQAHEGDLVLESIARRAKAKIAQSQLPDGTCGGDTGWSLQRLLVTTAECAAAAADNRQVVIRASGAFERHGKLVNDPYTAAALLATGEGSPELREAWTKLLTEATEDNPGGGKRIKVAASIVRADGTPVSAIEATAAAVLALPDGSLRNDLGATLLGAYSPGRGWGDGRTNLVAMRAVLALFAEPLPSRVELKLRRDGIEVASGAIDPKTASEVFVLEARDPDGPGTHEWEISSEPAIPGLAYSLSVATFGPWPESSREGGMELKVRAPPIAVVGQPTAVQVLAAVPPRAVSIEIGLPAGVIPDSSRLDKSVEGGTLSSYEIGEGVLTIKSDGGEPGKAFQLTVIVIPTFAGQLRGGPSTLRIGSAEVVVAPQRWTIRR